MVSDEGWKVAPVGGAEFSKAINQGNLWFKKTICRIFFEKNDKFKMSLGQCLYYLTLCVNLGFLSMPIILFHLQNYAKEIKKKSPKIIGLNELYEYFKRLTTAAQTKLVLSSMSSPMTCEEYEKELKRTCTIEKNQGTIVSAEDASLLDPNWGIYKRSVRYFGGLIDFVANAAQGKYEPMSTCHDVFLEYNSKCVGPTAPLVKFWKDYKPNGISQSFVVGFIYYVFEQHICKEVAEAPAARAPAAPGAPTPTLVDEKGNPPQSEHSLNQAEKDIINSASPSNRELKNIATRIKLKRRTTYWKERSKLLGALKSLM